MTRDITKVLQLSNIMFIKNSLGCCMIETKLTESVNDANVSVNNFTIFHCDRGGRVKVELLCT